MKRPPIPENFYWLEPTLMGITGPEDRIRVFQIVSHLRLDRVICKPIMECAHVGVLLGEHAYTDVTMTQDPKRFAYTTPMWPWPFEVVDHINFQASPFRAFMMLEVPAVSMSPDEIRAYCARGERIPFRVRLYS